MNIFDVMFKNSNSREVVFSSVYNYLSDPSETHGLGSKFLRMIIDNLPLEEVKKNALDAINGNHSRVEVTPELGLPKGVGTIDSDIRILLPANRNQGENTYETKFVIGTEVKIIDASANRTEHKDQLDRYFGFYNSESEEVNYTFALIYLVPSLDAAYCAKKFVVHVNKTGQLGGNEPTARGRSFILSWGVNSEEFAKREEFKSTIITSSVSDIISDLLQKEAIGDIAPISSETRLLFRSLRNYILSNFDRSSSPPPGRFPNDSEFQNSLGEYALLYKQFKKLIQELGGRTISAKTNNTSIGVPIPDSGGLLFRILTCKSYYVKTEEKLRNIQEKIVIELDDGYSTSDLDKIKEMLDGLAVIDLNQIHPNREKDQHTTFVTFIISSIPDEKLREFVEYCIYVRRE